MDRLTDTSPEAERVLIEAYRQMPLGKKWRQMGEIYHTAKVLHAAAVRLRKSTATDEEIRDAWMIGTLGEPLFQIVKEAMHGHGLDR